MAAKKTPKSATQAKSSPSFPDEVLSRVPASLRDRLPKIVASHGGLFAHGIPFRDPNDKIVVTFDPEGAFDLLEEYGESLPETKTFVPLALAGRRSDDEGFAIDPSKPELPVFFFEHEAGYHPFAPSLDAFLAGLLKKGEKTRLEVLEKIVDKAAKLDEREKYAEVVALLEPSLVDMPRTSSYDNDTVPRALNLLGIAYRHTGKRERAVATLEEAVALGEDTASLNLCELYEDAGNFERSIEIAGGLVSRGYFVGMYEWFWGRNYLGRGLVVTGNMPKATRAFHQIKVEFEVDKPAHLVEAAEGLRELAKRGGDVATRANTILSWFAAPVPSLTEAELIGARAWWKALGTKVRAKLAEIANVEDKPSDQDLRRVLRLESVDLEGCGIKDLSFLAPMRRLTSVDVGKNPLADLSTLPEMARLERLRVGEAKSLKSTQGIERAPNLESFYARECKIASLDGVAALTSLTELDVAQNKIADLGPVVKLTELEEVTVYENAITDLTPLAGCVRLKKLDCFGNDKIAKGLLALVELPRLDTINAITWKIPEKDLAAFSQARPDVELDVEGSKRRSWPPRKTTDADRAWWASLDAHPELRVALRKRCLKDDRPVDEQLGGLVDDDHVSIEGSGVKSIAPLASMHSLSFLQISGNPVTDLTGLGGLRKLEQLRARGTGVKSLLGLRDLTPLLELDVAETPITSLEGLEGCRNLRDLSFIGTEVSSLQPLAATSALREVNFGGTAVDDLVPLAKHRQLRKVDCAATRVTDLAPLAACTDLRRIDCFGLTGLHGLGALTELPHLRAVYSRGSLPAAELEAFRKARPDVDVD